jgi:hypothetical protein
MDHDNNAQISNMYYCYWMYSTIPVNAPLLEMHRYIRELGLLVVDSVNLLR